MYYYKNSSTEIEINVCDAVQKIKKVFRCPKRLLISKMGYFSEVTKGKYKTNNIF